MKGIQLFSAAILERADIKENGYVKVTQGQSTMDFLNVFRGLKKSNSETKLGDRLGFGRKSKSYSGGKSVQSSPLPPRPGRVSCSRQSSVTRIIENIPDDNIATTVSLHSPRRDTDQFGNAYEPLVIKGNASPSDPCDNIKRQYLI